MLRLITSLDKLPFSALMVIYETSNRENGRQNYPHLGEFAQIQEAEQDFYTYLKAFFRQENSFYALWEVNGICVSALRSEPYADGYLIAALETMPNCRNQGYGTALLQAVVRYLTEGNKLPVYSHIHKTNTPSLMVHRRAGFREFLRYAKFADGSVSQKAVTMQYKNNAD